LAEPEREIRDRIAETYVRELGACRALYDFVVEHILEAPWNGRTRSKGTDRIMWAEFARMTKTYRAGLLLISEGYAEQGCMMARTLFEGAAAAHWAVANESLAVENFRDHDRLSNLLWAERLRNRGWLEQDGERLDLPTADASEWEALTRKFGRYGTRLWTGHDNLEQLVADIEIQWSEGIDREELWDYLRVVNTFNNQILHTSSQSLTSAVSPNPTSGNRPRFMTGPSNFLTEQAALAIYWSYAQTVSLHIDDFELPDRPAFNDLYDEGRRAFVSVDEAVARSTGRNDPCPCGSGRKFKHCHGR
jgi:hypothetical protein